MHGAKRVQVDAVVERRPATGDDDVAVDLLQRLIAQQPADDGPGGRGVIERFRRIDALKLFERLVNRVGQLRLFVLEPLLLRLVHNNLHATDRQNVQQQREQQNAPP